MSKQKLVIPQILNDLRVSSADLLIDQDLEYSYQEGEKVAYFVTNSVTWEYLRGLESLLKIRDRHNEGLGELLAAQDGCREMAEELEGIKSFLRIKLELNDE